MLQKILNQKAMISAVLFAVFVGGIYAYMKIGKLEDAEIPMKTAMVITVYPGASAHEVELEVTDVLEKAIQKLENVKEIKSVSQPGVSQITVNIQETVKSPDLPQLWDHLRRKVNDAKGNLPAGCYEPLVNDDFADVYGMLYAITEDGYTDAELLKYTQYIERELLAIKGVRRSQIFGKSTECINISFTPEKLAKLNINPMLIAMALQNQSANVNPGSMSFGDEFIKIDVGSKMKSEKDIQNLLIQIPGGGNFKLGDIAQISRSTMEPKREALYFNGEKGLALGLSNESGVNVVELGERIDKKLAELKPDLPAGIQIHSIYSQPARVDVAVKDFVWNLIMSVAVVIVVLLFAMGFRSGLLISSGLVFTILATLIVMLGIGLPLHRVTLAAIILAMGMLVDNSIVVADGILVDLKKGVSRSKAFVLTAQRTALPLLGATAVAILAFMPLAMAPNMAGEFLSSLFTVLVISLTLSWVFAMIQTPFVATYFYREERPANEKQDSYDNKFYHAFRRFVQFSLKHKGKFIITSMAILILSFWAFRFVPMEFMPEIEYDQFVVEYNLPNGYDIDIVEDNLTDIQRYISGLEGVRFVSTSIGRPPARYSLMRYMPTGGQTYGELIIETKEKKDVKKIQPLVTTYINSHYPNAQFRLHNFGGKFADYDVEVMFTGPDPKVLRELGDKVKAIVRAEPTVGTLTDDWRNQVKILSPSYSVDKAQTYGISRSDMANSILVSTTGMPIGSFYEGDKSMPIILKTNSRIGDDMADLQSLPVWSQRSQSSLPLSQITDSIKMQWQNEKVIRFNGDRALRVQFDAKSGYTAAQVEAKVANKINDIELPHGYNLVWKGTVASSADANEALFQFLPLALGLMLIIIIGLFNDLKQAGIIFLIIPFAFVGISLGLNITGINMTFFAIIGALGLIGMMIKNAVVLLDEINLEVKAGIPKGEAAVNSAVSRMRPVMMASLTTILGMLPLIPDPMFQSGAITIMFGLLVGSVITLVFVPVLYVQFNRVYTKDITELKIES